ncbi:MAG: hypothetical protein CSA66_07655, partial [Proteobacteria bacterium]
MLHIDDNAPVRGLMADTVVSLTESHRVWEARDIFERCGLHHLPVIDERRALVGIVSHTDLYRAGVDQTFPEDGPPADRARLKLPISKIMRRDPVTVRPDDPVELALSILAEGSFHSLPVLDEEGRLVGMLTT